jgi:hypothetical protein
MITNRPGRNLSSWAQMRTGKQDLTMLSTIARILIGAAVCLLVLVAVAFAFAADLFSPKPEVQRVTRLSRGSLDPNVENVALFVEEAHR